MRKFYLEYAGALGAVIIWGGSFAATKTALAEALPLTVIWSRLCFGMPVLFLGMYLQKAARLPRGKEWFWLFVMGFQGIFFHQSVQSYAMQTAGTGNANWMMAATPAVVAFLSWIFLKEKISKLGLLGLAVAGLGVSLVLGMGTMKSGNFAGFGSTGDIIILLSVLNWAAFLIFSRMVLKTSLPSGFVIFWEMFFSLVIATPFLLFNDIPIMQELASFTGKTWLSLLFLGCFSSALAYLMWFHAISKIPVTKLVVFQFLQPLIGILLGYFLMQERFTIWLFVGGAMIVSGVYMVNKK